MPAPQGDPRAATMAQLRGHSRYENVLHHYLMNILAWPEQHKPRGKATISHARSAILGYVVYLAFAADPLDPDSGQPTKNDGRFAGAAANADRAC